MTQFKINRNSIINAFTGMKLKFKNNDILSKRIMGNMTT